MLIPVNVNQAMSEEEKRLIVSMIMCVGEWCLKIPIHSLLETSEFDHGCLHNVFDVRVIWDNKPYLFSRMGEISLVSYFYKQKQWFTLIGSFDCISTIFNRK